MEPFRFRFKIIYFHRRISKTHLLYYGITTLNVSPIETHVYCQPSKVRFHHFRPTPNMTHHDKA